METEGSLPRSQGQATCPYIESDLSSPCPTFHFLKIHFNIILPSTFRCLKCSLSFMPPYQNPVCTYSTHLILLDLTTRTKFCEDYRHKTPHYVVFSSSLLPRNLSGQNNLLSRLFLSRFSLYFSLNPDDQVSLSYKANYSS